MTEQQIYPLVNAAFNYDEERIRELLEAGQDKDTIQQAFEAACWDKSGPYFVDNPNLQAVLSLLLGAGAEVNRQDDYGNTPLFSACGGEGPNLTAIEFLLENGADPHARNSAGATVLHEISWFSCDPRAIYRMVYAGVDPTVRNADGHTALALAKQLLRPLPGRFGETLMQQPLERHVHSELMWYRELPDSAEFFRDPQILRLSVTANWHRSRARMAEREMQIRESILILTDAEEALANQHP